MQGTALFLIKARFMKSPENQSFMKNNFEKKKILLKGTPLSTGFSHGTAHVYRDILSSKQAAYNIRRNQYDSEYTRIHKAREKVRQHLSDSAKRVGASFSRGVADIFFAQETMLADPQLASDLKQTLRRKHINAEQVIGTVFRRWIRKFRDSPSKMLNERADDIEDLYRRMLSVLVGVEGHGLENLKENTIVVARRLLPSDTVFLSRKSCNGILLEIAGPTAHSTILARELGVPCVGQVGNLVSSINTGDEILVDGYAGTIIVNPDKDAVDAFNSTRRRFEHRLTAAWKNRFIAARPMGGKTVTVMANVGSREDVERASECGADGIGLFRTEGFFLAAKTLPTVDEFSRFLSDCLEPVGNKTATLRLLDIGGDKNIPYLSLPYELNPFLGRRGVRLLFDFPALLMVQLEAMLSVSRKFRVRVLIPMVTFPEEIVRIRRMLYKAANRRRLKPPPLGAMIETPAAALDVKSLSGHADFLCVGTNDLTQYVMAADRESALISSYFRDDHAIILNLLRTIVTEAGKKPVTLCGELAVKRGTLDSVLQTGISELSIAPSSIPEIKEAVRRIRLPPAKEKRK